MMNAIRFDDRVAVITGAGNGLGRAHALFLAARGARVVVNDYGTGLDGTGESSAPADKVVAEIRDAGGMAVADYNGVHSTAGAEGIARTALDHFGRIDILICNAGILVNQPFETMEEAVWRRTLDVHLDGTMHAARATWPVMKASGYGRMVFTSSGGFLGKHGLSAYAAAKAGIYGLMRALAVEGQDHNIRVNAILPVAQTRMISPDTRAFWEARPHLGNTEHVSALVAFLTSSQCPETGRAYTAGGGFVGREEFVQADGVRFDPHTPGTVEEIAARWDAINDLTKVRVFRTAMDSGAAVFGTD